MADAPTRTPIRRIRQNRPWYSWSRIVDFGRMFYWIYFVYKERDPNPGDKCIICGEDEKKGILIAKCYCCGHDKCFVHEDCIYPFLDEIGQAHYPGCSQPVELYETEKEKRTASRLILAIVILTTIVNIIFFMIVGVTLYDNFRKNGNPFKCLPTWFYENLNFPFLVNIECLTKNTTQAT